jgi:hypothetical protein
MRFLSGGMTNVAVVAFLPGDLAARMPTLSTDVKIRGDYARKIWEKHRLGHEAFALVKVIIAEGWCTQSRPNQLDFLYVDTRGIAGYYVLGIKADKRGRETWITTLFMIDEKETNRRLRKARKNNSLIRTAQWT